MTDVLLLLLGVSAAVSVALVVVIAARQPARTFRQIMSNVGHDFLVVVIAARQPARTVDFSGWYPPDEISEETAVALYFDAQWRAVAS